MPPKPEFSQIELTAMHRYCLRYRDFVRASATPTAKQDERFMLFQAVCYAEGVAGGR